MKELATALLAAQKQIKHAFKDANNPHYKNDYATLESVIDAVKTTANENGILIIQGCGKDENGEYCATRLVHAESGQQTESKIYLNIDKKTMQGLGSAITYARRYSLAAMFCIAQVDDDANTTNETKLDENFVINFGKKYHGKTIKQIGIGVSFAYASMLQSMIDQGKMTPNQDIKNFISIANELYDKQETQG